MLIEQNFELKGPGLPGRICTPITGCFHDKTIISKENIQLDCYLLLKLEVESRTQGSRPRPRTQKKSKAKAKDSLSEDRHSRGQGQEYSRPRPRTRPRTQAQVLPPPKKKVFTKIFQAISKKKKKKGLHKNFSSDLRKKTFFKKFLRGQGLQNLSSRTPPLAKI